MSSSARRVPAAGHSSRVGRIVGCGMVRTLVALVPLGALVALAGLAAPATLAGQGTTTAAIGGRIVDETGRAVARADIVVTNQATGATMRGRSSASGRYLVSGLDVGGPYTVTVRRVGARAQSRTGLVLALGQRLQLDVRLESQAVVLQGVESRAERSAVFSRARKGTETYLADDAIHHLPTLNRDLYDLVRLVPQMSTWSNLTASGANPRSNSVQVDGVNDQGLAGGVPAGSALGGRAIPLDAVSGYQVLLSPFDVRQGQFTGAAINAVTRHGSNEVHGSGYYYGTSERLGPNAPFVRDARYASSQLGFSLGGPIVRDRLHFFVVREVQRRVIPAIGPALDDAGASELPAPVRAQDVARFQRALLDRGIDGGSASAVENHNPSSSLFARVDGALPAWNSRFVLRGNVSRTDSFTFARPTPGPSSNCPTSACFALSSLQQRRSIAKRSVVGQLVSNLAGGGSNEVMLGWLDVPSSFGPTTRAPLVVVTVPGTSGQPATLQAGTHELSTGDSTSNRSVEVTDNLMIPIGAHHVTVGGSARVLRVTRSGLRGAFGVWEFAGLDSLEAGVASHYRANANVGSAAVAVRGGQYALYVSDDWDATSRLTLVVGVRADVPVAYGRPPYLALVDSVFHRRTDRVASGRVDWSPRVGFNYDATRAGGAPTQLRGGVGVFTGVPPLGWWFAPFFTAGVGTRTLACGTRAGDAGLPPPFTPDYRAPPAACAHGEGFAPFAGEIDLPNPRLHQPQSLRASLGADRRLPFDLVARVDALYTRAVHALFFSSANLGAPVGVDRHGRIMYGTVAASGVATPDRVSSRLGDVIATSEQSRDYAVDLTAVLQKTWATRGDAQIALSWGRSRDVQSQRVIRAGLVDNWRFSRTVAGRVDDLTPGISDFDQPLRVRATGTVHTPARRWRTDVTFSYVGGSGVPYTYVAGGAAARGDLNADGATGNDPIYVPRGTDTAEIVFAGTPAEVAAQQAALDRFIDGAPCLRARRGRIMPRNSCRSPWMHLTNLAVRQALPAPATHVVSLELQLFNVLNLLSSRWGRVRLPPLLNTQTSQIVLLSQVAQTPGTAALSQPVYTFDPATQRYVFQNIDSFYHIQLAARYEF